MTIGTNIKKLREKRKMTQTELAKRAGIGRSYMCEIEKGHKNPSVLVIINISGALKVGVAKLICG